MKILFMAPLPPPVTGHSLVSKVLLDRLERTHELAVVDLSKGSLHDGRISPRRILEVGKLLREVRRRRKRVDLAYLTIAESVAGNAKDLLIYVMCAGLLGRTVIHLHGGSIGRLLFDRFPRLKRVNRHFIGRLAGVIVSGPSHLPIFQGMIAADRLHVVPNFASDDVFLSEPGVREKFETPSPLRVLFISGMDRAKGYADLVEAYRSLPGALRARIEIDFAGRFQSASERAAFLKTIAPIQALHYHGIVTDAAKRQLLARTHLFCLPTRMFEGQPISILEAYASGCVVLTTAQPGILDIFTAGRNGHLIDPGSPASIARALADSLDNRGALQMIGLRNRQIAEENYRAEQFTNGVRKVLETAAGRA